MVCRISHHKLTITIINLPNLLQQTHHHRKEGSLSYRLAFASTSYVPSPTTGRITAPMAHPEAEAFAHAVQLASSSVLPMSLHAAMSLGVFDILGRPGPEARLSAEEIAVQLPAQNPDAAAMLDRVLRLLASFGVVSCSPATDSEGNCRRVYGLLPVSQFFARNEDGVSLVPLMDLMHDKIFLASWTQLKEAILEGGVPFDRVHGAHAFEYPSRDARFNDLFNKAMLNPTTIIVKRLLDSYDGFKHFNCLVDVGGGLGVTISMITSKYPSTKGINFDLPHVIEHAPAYPGVEHVGGDMFESVPKGDAIFMKWILHDWSDDHCVKLLKNCYDAIPEDGKVIVLEAVPSFVPDTTAVEQCTAQSDVFMMTQNPGGKERTREEFLALATKAGFGGIKFVSTVFHSWVMEFFK